MSVSRMTPLFLLAALSISSWAYLVDGARDELGNEPHAIDSRSPRIRFHSNKRDPKFSQAMSVDLLGEPSPEEDSFSNGYPPIDGDDSGNQASSRSDEDDSISIEARSPRIRFNGKRLDKGNRVEGGSPYSDEDEEDIESPQLDGNIPDDSHVVAARGPRIRFHDKRDQMGSAQDGYKRNQMENRKAHSRHRRSDPLRWSFNNDVSVLVNAFKEHYNQRLREENQRMLEDMLSKGK